MPGSMVKCVQSGVSWERFLNSCLYLTFLRTGGNDIQEVDKPAVIAQGNYQVDQNGENT